MEAAALALLLAAGFAVAKTAGPTGPSPKLGKADPRYREGFLSGNPNPTDPKGNPRPLPEDSVLMNTRKGASATGHGAELDLMFRPSLNPILPSEPHPGPAYGEALGYASMKPPLAPEAPPGISPAPQSLEAVKPAVSMNPAGVERDPKYGSGYITSDLTGISMPASDFKHNNMQPYFGGRIKQNMAVDTNISILDSYTGAGSTDIRKKEVETMFNTATTPYGNPFGMEDNTDFFQERLQTDPGNLRRRDGERPFEPMRIGSGLDEKFGGTGKGGFQQFEINEIMKRAMPTTDKLRVADKPKLSYNTPVVPGQRFTPAGPDNPGEVRKYKPDTFYIDEAGERFIGAFAEEHQAETARPIQVYKFVTRPETSSEFQGPAGATDFGQSYVSGEYRTPMAQQYGGAGYRNADMTGYFTNDPAQPEADYGKSSIEIRPNERMQTQDRVMGLNLAPADNVAVPVHYTDNARPTNRGETVGNIRQTGTPTGYAGGAPAVTVWDPSDVARTTVKETTIEWGNLALGVATAADMPTKLKVYDPDDIARPTQKSQISAKSEYFGGGNAVRKDFTSHEAAYNMRLNPNKEQVAKGRKPFAGNGNLALANEDPGRQTSKKLDADIINDRELRINSVTGLPPGSYDIGQTKYRVPLKLDVSLERNQPAIISAVEDNPLQQSLRRNAEADQRTLEQLYGRTQYFTDKKM
jgi:hypothetical protein